MDEGSELVAFRLPLSLIGRLETYTLRMRWRGGPATRADALRYLLDRALAERERDVAEVRTTFREVVRAVGGGPATRRRRRRSM